MNIPIVNSPDYFDFAELVSEFVKDQRTVLALTNSIVDKCNEVVHEEVTDALEDAGHPFQSIIRQQEEELAAVYGQLHAQQDSRNDLHGVLVNVCLTSPTILGFVGQSKKINAIKELRRLTGAGLKPCKEAVEDMRVFDASSPVEADWAQHVGTEQPPGWVF